MKSVKPCYKLAELTDGLDVSIKGDPNCIISGVSPIQQSQPGSITFLTNSLYRKYLSNTQASAVILSEEDAVSCPVTAIISRNPYYTYAKIATFFDNQPTGVAGIHPTAVIGENSEIDPTAIIGPHCILGKRVRVGQNVNIGAGCVIGDEVEIGSGTRLDAHVTLYYKVSIGKRSHLLSGVVVGSDGFGFANQRGVWHRVPQLGGVQIGNDVTIGANTTIDRGAVEDTIIEDGVKLDNLIQVGHNVKIGANTIIAGCTGIAGSTTIGKNCMIGGASCLAGHITICDQVIITGMTSVSKSIHEPGMYSSGIVGAVPNHEFRKNNARFYRLENYITKIKALEAAVKELTERSKS